MAITCRDDAEWRALIDALPSDDVLRNGSFKTLAGRIDGREQIHDALAALFRAQPAAAWEQTLGRRGIPCVRALHDDEVLVRRDFWEGCLVCELPLRNAAPLTAGGPPWRSGDNTPALPAPSPGQDTEALRADPEAFWRARSTS